MTIYKDAVGGDHQTATLIIAASDSLHTEQADYVCTGSGDQTTIQTAITAAGGREIYLLDGTYDFSGYIETTANGLTISGPGATLFLHASTNGQLIQIKHSDITINGMTLDGNGANQTSGNGLIEVTANASDLTIDHVHFKNAWNAGLYSVGSSGNNRLDGLMMSSCIGEDFYNGITHYSAIAYISYANNIQIDHCRIDNFDHNVNIADGIKVIHATNIQISHILIKNITGHGIFVGYGSKDIDISGIIFACDTGTTLESVCVEFAADGTATGADKNERVTINNVLHKADAGGNQGIYVETCKMVTVSNCVVETPSPLDNATFLFKYIWGATITNCIAKGKTADGRNTFTLSNLYDVTFTNCQVIDSDIWVWVANPYSAFILQDGNENVSFIGCVVQNVPTCGIMIQNASQTIITGCVFEDCGTNGGAAWAIQVSPNRGDISIVANRIYTGASANTKGILLESNSDDCIITDNYLQSTLTTSITVGAGCDNLNIRNNTGYITENSGTATLVNGTTSIAVAHGLVVTPVIGDIVVTPIEAWGNMTTYYIGNYTASHFTIYSPINPGQDVDFAWKAIVL